METYLDLPLASRWEGSTWAQTGWKRCSSHNKRIPSRVPNFEQTNYSSKDGTRRNGPLFRRNFACFAKQKTFEIPFRVGIRNQKNTGILLQITPKLKIYVEIRYESFRSWKFSSKFVMNHSKAENFCRNSLRIIPKLKIFVGILFRYQICGICSVSNLSTWEKSVNSILLFCKDLLFRIISSFSRNFVSLSSVS